MFAFVLSSFLIFGAVASSGLPKLTNAAVEILVDDSLAIGKGSRSLEEVAGTYKKRTIKSGSFAEERHFDQMRLEAGSDMQMIGQWKRTYPKARYLLGFTPKSTRTMFITRWMITSYTISRSRAGQSSNDNTVSNQDNRIICDTGRDRSTFPNLREIPESPMHASNSATDSTQPIQKQDDLRGIDVLSQGLFPSEIQMKELRDEMKLKSQELAAIVIDRDLLRKCLQETQLELRKKLKANDPPKVSEVTRMREEIQRLNQDLAAVVIERDISVNSLKEQTVENESLNQKNSRLIQRFDEQQREHSKATADYDNLVQQREQLLVTQEEQKNKIITIGVERDTSSAALEKTSTENAHLASQLVEANERISKMLMKEANDAEGASVSNQDNGSRCEDGDEKSTSPVVWCCITVAVVILVVLLIFCIYHRSRLGKEKEEVMRLKRVISINKNHRTGDVIIDTFLGPKRTDIEGNQNKEPKLPEGEGRNVEKLRHGESFNDLMQNIDEVQGVMMDDIMDEMVTEGAEENNKGEGCLPTGASSDK